MKRTMLALAGALLLATNVGAAERLSPWVSAWSTGLVSSEIEKPPIYPEGPFVIREVVRLTAAGPRVRLRLSNAFGTTPLRIDGAHVALPAAPDVATQHRSARTTTYLAPGAITNLQWLQLVGVEVDNAKGSAIAAFGDSITDGSGAGVNRYERWPDILAERLQADPRTRNLSVINAGIGANRLLKDGTSVSGLARLDRDVFSQPGVTTPTPRLIAGR